MLTVKEIKKIFDNFEVEGFSFRGFEEIGKFALVDDIRRFYEIEKEIVKSQAYQLFLQKTKQGINKQSELDLYIVETRHHYLVLDWEYNIMLEEDVNDKGLEQAIKYILGKI